MNRRSKQVWNPQNWRQGFPEFVTSGRRARRESVNPFHPAFELVLNDEAEKAARRGASLGEICAALPDHQRGGTR